MTTESRAFIAIVIGLGLLFVSERGPDLSSFAAQLPQGMLQPASKVVVSAAAREAAAPVRSMIGLDRDSQLIRKELHAMANLVRARKSIKTYGDVKNLFINLGSEVHGRAIGPAGLADKAVQVIEAKYGKDKDDAELTDEQARDLADLLDAMGG